MKASLLLLLAALVLAGCAKPVPGTDQSRMSVGPDGHVVAQDQDGRDFNMEAKQKAAKASPRTTTK